MVIDFLHPINFVFYIPLMFLSVSSIALITERVHDVLKTPLLDAETYRSLLNALRKRDLQPVNERLQHGNHIEILFVREFLQLRKTGTHNILGQLELFARELIISRESRLDLLGAMSGVATMLGLLGTVTGMIWSFQAMSGAGRPDPAVLSGGIAQALITTALGLFIAIPALSTSSVLKLRARMLSNRLEFLYEEMTAIQMAKQG